MIFLKNKNILLLGALAFAVYYLTKNSMKKETPAPVPDDGETDLNDVINGDEPSSQKPMKPSFTKEDLQNKKQAKKLVSKKLGITLVYNLPYRGGARPSQETEYRSGKWTVQGTKEIGKSQEGFQNRYATQTEVEEFVFQNPENWSLEFGKKAPDMKYVKDKYGMPRFVPQLGQGFPRIDKELGLQRS